MMDMPNMEAEVQRVIDGDTVQVHAYPWPGMTMDVGVRLDGVDTPELRGRCPEETAAAERAKDATRSFLEASGNKIRLVNVDHDKYGRRVVADIVTEEGSSLGAWLIEKGFGRAYTGGKRAGWCEGAE